MKIDFVKLKTKKGYDLITNRMAVTIGYKEPFKELVKKSGYAYLNQIDSGLNIDKNLPVMMLFQKDDRETIEEWIKRNYKKIFISELRCWLEKSEYPEINYRNFKKYINLTFSNLVFDNDAGQPIEMV